MDMPRLSVQTLQDHAQSFGGSLVQTYIEPNNSKHLWKCRENHIFLAKKFKKSWCPDCGDAKKGQYKKLTLQDL